MQKIKTANDLKDTIQQLELRQATELTLLKAEFHVTCENLKPINIIKSALKQVYSSPDLKATIVKGVMGFTTGFLTKKLMIGKSADGIKSIGKFILNKVTGRNNNSENE